MKNMKRKYENNPIVEVVCEFQLSPDTPWDPTIPGVIYEKIRDKYKNKGEQNLQSIEFTAADQGQGMTQKIRTQQRAVFLTEDKKTAIQVGQKLLAINRFSPYKTWEEFKPEIDLAFSALTNTVDDITGFQRIGLRYLNKIEIPGIDASSLKWLIDYFEFRPFFGDNLPQTYKNFIAGFVASVHDGRDDCKTQLAMGTSDKFDTAVVILDMDYFFAKPQSFLKKEEALAWVDDAHTEIKKIFEGCITDRLRALLKEIK